MTPLVKRITDILATELAEHGTEDDDEKRLQVAHHWAEKVLDALTPELEELASLREYRDDAGLYVAKSKMMSVLWNRANA
jgi:hypothetical protein